MTDTAGLYIGGPAPQYLLLNRANRHGLITGATGTGKTVTLQVLAEGFSRAGVPVFAADIKGDLSGLSQAGASKPFIAERIAALGLKDFSFEAAPCVYWDIFGKSGHPLRSTISEMGPLLLARILELSEAQEGVLNIAFKVADDEGLLLLDLKDLQALLTHIAENADQLTTRYGNVAKATVGTIQRSLLTLENQGGAALFGEPALELADFLRTDLSGRGIVNILAADQLFERPQLYASFLLWLLSELFEVLPEIGDPEKPRLVFFFDEAHLLFDGAPKPLLTKVAQVVRLIRSKGVGVYFVTQNPDDVPGEVLAQLGNRVHHALRAFTPKEQKAVRAAADSLRPNPAFDTAEIIGTLGVGEALVSMLDAKGSPCMVERTLIAPPRSRAGAISAEERQAVIQRSPFLGKYDRLVDRDSAYERLTARQSEDKPGRAAKTAEPRPAPRPAPHSNRQSVGEAFAKSVVRSIGSSVGREIIRGVLGSILRR
jgi:DNA double-strand break repair helicase HerA and related ATPase